MENCYWNYTQTDLQLLPWLPPPFDTVEEEEEEEDRAATASRSHSEAEKRRRDRINAQLATLRKLIPKSEKMDKAALLGHVVEHVKEQSQRAKEMSKGSTLPTETDEVIIDQLNAEESTYISQSQSQSESNHNNIYMKASICCDDRPELFAELKSALKGIAATIVEAEITSLGGRMKANFIVCTAKDHNSLKLALSRVVVSSTSSTYSTRSKRQRFFYPNLR